MHDGVGTGGVELGDVGGMPDEVCDGASDRGVHDEGGADGDDRADGGCMAGVDERVADEVQEDGRRVHDDDEGHVGGALDGVRGVYNDDEGCKVIGDVRGAYRHDKGCKVGGDDVGIKENIGRERKFV